MTMPLNSSEISKAASDLIANKGIPLIVPLTAKGIIQKLRRRLGIQKTQRVFDVTPIKVGVAFQISAIAAKIPEHIIKNIQTNDDAFSSAAILPALEAYYEDVVEIIALGLTNSKHGPKESLKAFIREEFDLPLLLKALHLVMHQIKLEDFLTSIVLVKGAKGLL